MTLKRPSVEQTDPPRPPRETLPTMYDLPSEDLEEPGLPDEFHDLQPQLLSATFQPPIYSKERIFTGTDLNLYYDVDNPQWYKRPDWFAVAGVSRLYEGRDLRLSYVVWQERVNPFVVVELLSPGTEKEDLGETESPAGVPPTKWQVYEQILRVPYYVVFSRYTNRLRAFRLTGGHYQELELASRFWIAELGIGLGVWQGRFQDIERLWLRWYNARGNWITTEVEEERQRAEQERQRAEQAEQQLENLLNRLKERGINPEL